MGQKSGDVIRVKQQKNVPYEGKPELELTELLHLGAGVGGRGGWGGGQLDYWLCDHVFNQVVET